MDDGTTAGPPSQPAHIINLSSRFDQLAQTAAHDGALPDSLTDQQLGLGGTGGSLTAAGSPAYGDLGDFLYNSSFSQGPPANLCNSSKQLPRIALDPEQAILADRSVPLHTSVEDLVSVTHSLRAPFGVTFGVTRPHI